ncbi:MAG: response regulator [Firmicutes bacterium]|nr:response regulator [Bacillota bacterium]
MAEQSHTVDYGRMTAIINCMGDGVIATDVSGIINYMNSSAEQITGWQQQEALGRELTAVFSLFHAETNEPLPLPLQEIMAAGEPMGLMPETMLRCRDGSGKYLSASCASIRDARGKVSGAVIVFRDITRRKKAEEQLLKAKEAAEAANRAKSEFLANMSHEIRTPINGIIGMIDLTLLTPLNSEQRDNLLTAKKCADSLLLIINDILDFSKIEAGKMKIEAVPFNLRELLGEIMKTHGVSAQKKGLKLKKRLDASVPVFLIGDPTRLRQVIDNLVNNAIKFTEQGHVTLSVQKTGERDGKVHLQFAVSDTGIGIERHMMGKLFQSFSQVDSSTTRKFGGTGLGLVISKQLVEKMGGSIWAHSEPGMGSTFAFSLPFLPAEKSVLPKEQEPVKLFKVSRPRTILVVEDDRVNQEVLARLLKERGHRVDVADNGLEALAMHAANAYDLILMDIQMPQMDGIEAAARIRERERGGRHTPIVALTAFALQGDRERFLSLGMDEYLPKPIRMEELYAMVDRVLSTGRQAAFRGHVSLNADGELVVTDNKEGAITELAAHLPELEALLVKLQEACAECDLERTELYAHKMKELFFTLEAEELKYAMFKIELAARRGNSNDTALLLSRFQDLFATYKKVLCNRREGICVF